GLLDAQVHVLAAVLQAAVAEHRARQQAGLEQYLKAVADAEHRAAALGEPAHGAHDRREARHRAGAQVVAVREAARQDHDVGALRRWRAPEDRAPTASAYRRGARALADTSRASAQRRLDPRRADRLDKRTIEDVVHVLQLLVEIEGALDLVARQHAADIVVAE